MVGGDADRTADAKSSPFSVSVSLFPLPSGSATLRQLRAPIHTRPRSSLKSVFTTLSNTIRLFPASAILPGPVAGIMTMPVLLLPAHISLPE